MCLKDAYFLCVIAVIQLARVLPAARLAGLTGNSLASLAYHCSRNKRRLIEQNVLAVLGDSTSERARKDIVKGAFREFWRDILSLSFPANERATIRMAEIHGLERLKSALNKGKGVIVWESGTFGSRNLAKQILRENGFPVHQLHSPWHLGGFEHKSGCGTWMRLQVIRPFLEACERRFVADIIYLSDSDSLAFTRQLTAKLKENAIICVRADISYGKKLVPARVLGYKKFLPTGMLSLAKLSGATLLPLFCFRERTGRASLILEKPIDIPAGLNRIEVLQHGTTEYLRLLESYIKQYPEQYQGWMDLHESYANRLDPASLIEECQMEKAR